MPNKIYTVLESEVTWRDSGGTNVITLASLAAGAGRQGALHDFGTSARAREYAWRAFVRFATAPVLGETIEIYWKTSDGAHPDNDDGTGDAAVSAIDKLKNLDLLGVIVVDQATLGIEMVAHGILDMPHRHGAPVFWNASADALHATAANNGFGVIPVPWEVQ